MMFLFMTPIVMKIQQIWIMPVFLKNICGILIHLRMRNNPIWNEVKQTIKDFDLIL